MSSALRDPLTLLFNRRYFLDRLDSELKFARRHQASLSLLLLDLDHFKRINDTDGHLAGDAVLVNLSDVLFRAVREETTSIGAAEYPTSKAETVEALIECADKALYRAKDAGRNRVSRLTLR